MNSEKSVVSPEVENPKTKWLVLFVLCLAVFITVLDSTLLYVSLPTLVKDFHTNIKSLQWVISVYSLILAALTITGGRLGDFFGRKKMFMLGAVIFAVGSFITSISHSIPVLIIGESIIEGIGAALMVPATSALILANFKGRDRATAFGLWAGFASIAAATGPILGGYFTTDYTWRYGFRINIFVVVLLLLSAFIIKDSKDKAEEPRLDILGVILSSLGLLFIVFGIIESSIYGWWKAREVFNLAGLKFSSLSVCPVALILGLAVLLGFVFWELHMARQNKTPLVSMNIFKNRQFSTGTGMTILVYLGFAGISFSIPILLQSIAGITALKTGIALVPYSVSIFVFSQVSAYLSKRIRPRLLIQAGLLVDAAGLIFLRAAFTPQITPHALILGLAVCGAGVGLVFAQFTNLTLSALPVDQAGEASGVYNTVRQLGVSFATAITGSVLIAAIATNLVSGVAKNSVIPDSEKPEAQALVTTQASNIEFGGIDVSKSKLSELNVNEIISISHKAVADAGRHAIDYNISFILISFAFSFILTRSRDLEASAEIKPAASH